MRMDFLKNEPWQEGPQASSAAVSGQLGEPGARSPAWTYSLVPRVAQGKPAWSLQGELMDALRTSLGYISPCP